MPNIKINEESFLELLNIQAVTRNQKDVIDYTMQQLHEIQKKVYITFTQDDSGNILVTKGDSDCYMCLTCHLDTVYVVKKDYEVHVDQKKYFAKTGKEKTSVGGDDKCGIFAILQILKHSDKPFKAVFFSDEKSNRNGANKIDMTFFSDVGFLVALDRQGKGDLVTTVNFKDLTIDDSIRTYLMPIARKYGYMETGGKMSSVFTIQSRMKKEAVSAINISCGFFHPVSNEEHIEEEALLNCIMFVIELLDEYPGTKFTMDKNK